MRRVLLGVAALSLCGPLAAQTTQAELQARLRHKPLYLSGQWRSDKLQFDAAGHLVGSSDLNPCTLSGIDVRTVKLDKGGLKIDGERVGMAFVKDTLIRKPLGEKIHLEIGPQPMATMTWRSKQSFDLVLLNTSSLYRTTLRVRTLKHFSLASLPLGRSSARPQPWPPQLLTLPLRSRSTRPTRPSISMPVRPC